MQYTSLVSSLLKHATLTPKKPAIQQKAKGLNREISYAELARLVSFYSQEIHSLGLKNQQKVVLCLENSPEYIALLYACWSLNLTVIPLHSQSKAREINHVIQFTDAQLFIAFDKHPYLKEASIQSLALPSDKAILFEPMNSLRPLHARSLNINSKDIALILFTSGSTGNPKGVMLSHQNLIANTLSIVEYLSLSANDKVYCVLPFTYSYGNSVLQTHIFSGACIQIGQSMVYPQKVAEDLQDRSITGFSGVPSTFQLLLQKTSFAKQPPKLRYLTQAGGAMTIHTTEQLLNLLPNTEIFVMYGQTEASARLSYLPPDKLVQKAGSIGLAIPGVSLAIVDEQGRHLAAHQTGELVAQGENIMQGYWQNPEASRETLKDGWLHTGDLGYKDEDGYIFIKGRKKQMIKSGANRIHPEEIEEVILACPVVAEVAVTGIEDELLGEVIAAFVVAKQTDNEFVNAESLSADKSDRATEEKQIRLTCRQLLAPYKQPKIIVWVEALPKTSSGKIRRHLLVPENQPLNTTNSLNSTIDNNTNTNPRQP